MLLPQEERCVNRLDHHTKARYPIFMTEQITPHTFLQSIERMADEATEEGFSLRQIFDRLDERAFGAALFILALPCCIPFLYGVPQVVSLPMMALAAQMVAGREEPWLPEKFAKRMIDKKGLTRTAKGGRKWFGWLEKIARPRFTFLMGNRGERIIGLFLVFFCASILVPLPSTNTVPGIGVAIVAFGLMARDGILVILGSIIGTAWIATLIILVALGIKTVTGS
ncbi:exopolysaccharide biosynthesis protein [Henriciella sp. AS95]|uniref:exopolysaccharide biosynthesis protein n=1 Tax=Henriciella sp. AS95 TaxID=3135782 RepID=UPI00317633E7